MSNEEDRLGAKLLLAVTDLNANVMALQRTLVRDYPKRVEADGKYASKIRVSRGFKYVATGILFSMLISLLVTYTVLSQCFLSQENFEGKFSYEICQVMPGYESSRKRNKELLAQFHELVAQIEENREEIARLQKRRARR